MDERPIGVFDSGVGGLTVARALIDLMPNESILYFGDSARGPYGPRRSEEVRLFSTQIAEFLVSEGVKMIVIACNSASSAALDAVRAVSDDVPVLEVVLPAVRAAVKATRNRRIGVIGTALTVSSGAYDAAVAGTKENVSLMSAACPRFVEFVERGETSGEEVVELGREYLAPLQAADVDTLILGCTHYPLLSGVIHFVMGHDVVLISSADETARDAYALLTERGAFREKDGSPEHRFISSGDAALFQALGTRFLGPEIGAVQERLLGGVR
ncbi:MAG: glutamate racemase [Actinomycetota bacterium]|nr:glutamate racemase [Actinomycetota bacterium]